MLEMPGIGVDGLCEETRTMYEFNGCYWHGHTFMPVRDTPTEFGGQYLGREAREQFRACSE